MSIYETIIAAYPELKDDQPFIGVFDTGQIVIQNDSDGKGDFIAVWNYDKPIPKGLKLGK